MNLDVNPNEVANRTAEQRYSHDEHITLHPCPICGEMTPNEYCDNCLDAVSSAVNSLEEWCDTDYKKALDLLGYYYERNI